jgi:ABC-type Mn2+/Zn2+ transport system permease subunit
MSRKSSSNKKAVLYGLITLFLTPFIAYFGAKLYVPMTCDPSTGAYCGLNEMSTMTFIAIVSLVIAAGLFLVGTLKNRK